MYLVKPPADLKWIDLPPNFVLLSAEHGVLDRLEWKESGYPLTREILELAFRRGRACALGILVDVAEVHDLNRPAELRTLIEKLIAHDKANRESGLEDLMEALMPGWIENGKKLEEGVYGSQRKRLQELEAKRSALLSGNPDPELVAHWASLGGSSL